MFFDPVYMIILFGFMGIGSLVSSKLKSKMRKYSKIPLKNNLSGREIAEIMLRDHNIHDVKVISVPGQLTDHYNPFNKTVNLSPDVFEGKSITSASVAAHECGHAVQHANQYGFLQLRSALVPIQNFSSKIMSYVIWSMILGAFFLPSFISFDSALMIIIFSFSISTLFTFVTLPVEFDASNRAVAWVTDRQIVTREESVMARDALKWAAMTYVVVALQSLAMLLYYLSIFLRRR